MSASVFPQTLRHTLPRRRVHGVTCIPRVLHGDALDHLRTLDDASIDAIITDPPYGLTELTPARIMDTLAAWVTGDTTAAPQHSRGGFRELDWDGFVPPPAIWRECFRVLKPGGHLAAFAGARTFDLMGVAIRLGGFEIRDSLAWVSASGTPKGRRLAHYDPALAGLGTQLKPAMEPIVLARVPLRGTTVETVRLHGTGALQIDRVRVPYAGATDRSRSFVQGGDKRGHPTTHQVFRHPTAHRDLTYTPHAEGRFPPNVLLSHAPDCDDAGCVPGCVVAALDDQSGVTSRIGGASRFFPILPVDSASSRVYYAPKAPAHERPVVFPGDGRELWHPTVKPLSVMRWLVRLLTPAGGVVLDPFAGSGTTLEAAMLEGFASIGVEREADYLPLIAHRVRRAGVAHPSAAEL